MDAAEALLIQKGFAGMTVAEVAEKAGVSTQTVYAVFSSKAGIIMAAIEDRVISDDRNVDTIKQLESSANPVVILRGAAHRIWNIYEGNAPTFTAVYGASMVFSQLAQLERKLFELRLEKQAPLVETLLASGKLLPHLDEETVRDILWALTSRDMYHLLVIRCGWTPERYETHVSNILISSLVRPATIQASVRK